ncbi:fibronectin type III domain-containing protein [Candidatus Margulisiibacteriota bacterium]
MRKLVFLLILSLLISSSAQCAKLMHFDKIKGHRYILLGTSQTLEASGMYEDEKEYSSHTDLPAWEIQGNAGTVSKNGIFKALKAGTAEVRAYKDGKAVSLTITVTTESLHTPPQMPTGLKVTDIEESSAIALWDDPTAEETYYILSIGTDNSASNGGVPYMVQKPYRVNWDPSASEKLKQGTTYYIKLAAFNEYGLSDWSDPVSFTTK